MLFKNFGVTRHGRVVFYDYDEICYMTEVNFRRIPEPLYPEQELSGEPWYSIREQDVFQKSLLNSYAKIQKFGIICWNIIGICLARIIGKNYNSVFWMGM